MDAASSFIGSHNIVESSVFLDAQEAEKQRRKEAGTQEAVTQDSGPKLPYEGVGPVPLFPDFGKIIL